MKDDVQVKEVGNFKKEADDLKTELAKIEKAITERDKEKGRALLLAKIEAKKLQVKSTETEDKKCNNIADLDLFAGEAKNASTDAAIKRIGDEVDQWDAKYMYTKDTDVKDSKVEKPKVDTPEPPVKIDIEPFRGELKAKVQAMLDDPENSEEKIENREDLEEFMSKLGEAKAKDELDEIKGDIEKWKPRKRIVSVWRLLFVLIVLGAIGFFVKKLLSGKTVATISFQKTGSTDAAVKAEAKLNKPLRFDELLECEVDIRATPKHNEAGNLEFELTSPNKTVWLLKLGNDKKKQITDVPVLIEEGVYQIFDNEIAMQPMGKAEFESIEVM
jgi:hypothetical protein